MTGHTGSVLCLQYDERVIVTGSSDSTVRYAHDLGTKDFRKACVFKEPEAVKGLLLLTLKGTVCKIFKHLMFRNEWHIRKKTVFLSHFYLLLMSEE